MRRGEQAWQPIEDVSSSFAPSGDFMGFLSSASNVVRKGEETRNGTTFVRYAFTLDGPGYARYVRDQLQDRMSTAGKLPVGAVLELPEVYKGMTGDGELWVRPDGLPLRQIINARFPPQNDFVVQAKITVDFSDYPEPASRSLASWGGSTTYQIQQALHAGVAALKVNAPTLPILPGALLLIGCAMFVIIVRYPRSRPIYATLVVVVVLAMEATPADARPCRDGLCGDAG